MIASLKAIGDWDKQIGVPLQTALAAAVEITGNTGEKACRKALYWMAVSAQKLTKVAPPTRPVSENPGFVHLLRKGQYKSARMSGKDMSRYYRFSALRLGQKEQTKLEQTIYANTRPPIAKIGRRGLAVRSWQWGLAQMGGKSTTRPPIAGVTELWTLYGRNAGPRMSGIESIAGYVLRNKLSYIRKAMPIGWETEVERKAGNRIMGEAREMLRRKWASTLAKSYRGEMYLRKLSKDMSGQALAQFFTTGDAMGRRGTL